MNFQLRPARLTDLPAIYRGEERYIRTWEPAHEDQWRSQLERHLTRWVSHFERFIVAVSDEVIVGYAFWVPEPPYAELHTIAVEPECRRSGIGRALLNAFMADATPPGLTHLRLSVRPDNPARFLYEQAGFVCTGVGAHDYLIYQRPR